MSNRFKIIGLLLGGILLSPLPGYAASTDNTTETDREARLEASLQQVTEQTKQLQEQVSALQAELHQVKTQKQTVTKSTASTTTTTTANAGSTNTSSHTVKTTAVATTNTATTTTTPTSTTLATTDTAKHYRLGFPVTTSPYIGLRSAYDASDLIVNFSSMNEDLRLLQRRQALDHDLADLGISSAYGPYAILSGAVEGQAMYIDPYNSADDSISSVNLTRAELDTFASVSPWAQGYMSFSYDNTPFDEGISGSGNPISNSRIYLQRGFLTIGNLDQTPFYLTMGQMYAPFGDYSNYMLSNPDTKALARTTARAVLLGYSHNGIYASSYVYNGPSDDSSNDINEYGANLGYKFSADRIGGNFGGGVISTIADSNGMQDTGASSGFQGFGESNSTENILHKVPAADVHGELDLGKVSLISEYIWATRSFDPQDLTFNTVGAKPRALHAEADYLFNLFAKPSVLGFAYDESWQSLALGMPKNSYTGIFSISIWKNTIESLEFRHDVNYAGTDTAGGRCDTSTTNFCLNPTPAGGQQNMITGQIGVYF